VVLAVAATMLVAGVVVAVAHDGRPTKKVIHACVDDQTGAIQIVGGNDHCAAGESPLDWNGKGPRGAQGPPGPAGETGFEHLTVVTASKTVAIAVGSTSESLLGVGDGVGVGVDCPGDSIATGGGGSGSANRPLTEPVPAGPVTTYPTPLVATQPLEKDSTTDVAESGDLPTGWFAMVTDFRIFVTVEERPQGGPQPQQFTVTVHAWAVCTDEGVI
ncbi:MAG TPA: hypothetical protein VFK59_10745, partial [Actinomycetota bacterium]|nr:hypothetical protein [Actinomycetota bacterium]